MSTSRRIYRSTDERRREIIEATIRVLAEQGFAQTSFQRIQGAANLSSTRMISYHFADKAALLEALVEHVIGAAAEVMVPAMEREPTMRGKLAAYIGTNMRFLAQNPLAARAVLEVIANAPRERSELREDTSTVLLAVLLSQGQEAGEFCDFDTTVMARAIRAVIDSFAMSIPGRPGAADQVIAQTVALFERATTTEGTPS